MRRIKSHNPRSSFPLGDADVQFPLVLYSKLLGKAMSLELFKSFRPVCPRSGPCRVYRSHLTACQAIALSLEALLKEDSQLEVPSCDCDGMQCSC
jgi:hypothetical protein